MLFLTVYGPELASLFGYIQSRAGGAAVSREQIYDAYVPQLARPSQGQRKNIEDALGFLQAARLIEGERFFAPCVQAEEASLPFAVLLLRRLRQLELQQALHLPPLDLLYIQLLERLFIAPDRLWIHDLHTAVNQLDLAQQAGGVSQEKIGAWKRVMEFLGAGYRVGNGFYCLYRPELLLSIARQWAATEGTLQDFLERHLHQWIPCLTTRSDVARSASHALEWLAGTGSLAFSPRQDSPSRPYFRDRLRGISVLAATSKERNACFLSPGSAQAEAV